MVSDSESTDASERGFCHQCGSGEVFHVVYGMVMPGIPGWNDGWMRLGGCVIEPDSRNRCCGHCGATWDEVDGEVVHQNFAALKDWWEATTEEDFLDALERRFEWRYDLAQVPHDYDPDGVLTLTYGVHTIDLTFPVLDAHFHATVGELNDAITHGFALALGAVLDDAKGNPDGE